MRLKTLRAFVRSACVVLALLVPILAQADMATLTWNANTESDLAGYKLYQGTVSGQYGPPMDVGNVLTTTRTLPTLTVDQTYFFALTAYDKAGNESGKSIEVSKKIVGVPPVVTAVTTVMATVQGDPKTGPWAVLLTITNAPAAPYTVDVYVNGVLDHTEQADPRCSWGDASTATVPAPCTQVLKPAGTYVIEFRVLKDAKELARTAITVVVPDLPPAIPQGLVISSATASEIVITARASECPTVTFSGAAPLYTVACRR